MSSHLSWGPIVNNVCQCYNNNSEYLGYLVLENVGKITSVADHGLLIFEEEFTSQENTLTKIIIYDIVKNQEIFKSEVSKFVRLIAIT